MPLFVGPGKQFGAPLSLDFAEDYRGSKRLRALPYPHPPGKPGACATTPPVLTALRPANS